jgi:hypothetical protein
MQKRCRGGVLRCESALLEDGPRFAEISTKLIPPNTGMFAQTIHRYGVICDQCLVNAKVAILKPPHQPRRKSLEPIHDVRLFGTDPEKDVAAEGCTEGLGAGRV